MPAAPRLSQPQFHGYVLFDDPDWWHCYAVTQECARAIDAFRQAVAALQSGNQKDANAYEATVDHLWELSECVVNHMQWHARRDVAVILTLAQLYDACVDQIMSTTSRTAFIRSCLDTKATAIRNLLSTMHDFPCGRC